MNGFACNRTQVAHPTSRQLTWDILARIEYDTTQDTDSLKVCDIGRFIFETLRRAL